nr:immunoglobulin light chain junction region [Macaca mulatta]MOY09704.1 immunoglobulin light chain junction region [Macaca mulatta]
DYYCLSFDVRLSAWVF